MVSSADPSLLSVKKHLDVAKINVSVSNLTTDLIHYKQLLASFISEGVSEFLFYKRSQFLTVKVRKRYI